MAVVIVPVAVAVTVAVVMAAAEQQRRHDVDDEAEHRDRQRLVVVDRLRASIEVLDALLRQPERDQREHDAARVAGERVDLAGAEAERVVTGARACVPVRDQRQAERADVGAHVPAVGGERDRAGPPADDQLADHHHGGDRDDPASPALAGAIVIVLVLVMDVLGQIVCLHTGAV